METRTLKSKIGIYMLLSVLAVLVVIPFVDAPGVRKNQQ